MYRPFGLVWSLFRHRHQADDQTKGEIRAECALIKLPMAQNSYWNWLNRKKMECSKGVYLMNSIGHVRLVTTELKLEKFGDGFFFGFLSRRVFFTNRCCCFSRIEMWRTQTDSALKVSFDVKWPISKESNCAKRKTGALSVGNCEAETNFGMFISDKMRFEQITT